MATYVFNAEITVKKTVTGGLSAIGSPAAGWVTVIDKAPVRFGTWSSWRQNAQSEGHAHQKAYEAFGDYDDLRDARAGQVATVDGNEQVYDVIAVEDVGGQHLYVRLELRRRGE